MMPGSLDEEYMKEGRLEAQSEKVRGSPRLGLIAAIKAETPAIR